MIFPSDFLVQGMLWVMAIMSFGFVAVGFANAEHARYEETKNKWMGFAVVWLIVAALALVKISQLVNIDFPTK